MGEAITHNTYKYPSSKKIKNGISTKKILLFKKWIYSNSFNNNFYEPYRIDYSQIELVKSLIKTNVHDVKNILLKIENPINKANMILTLVLLSDAHFTAKRIFKQLFLKKIQNLEDLYLFVFYARKLRGFGKIIKNSINEWLKRKTARDLDFECIRYVKKYGWSLKDIINLTHPKPENREKQIIYNWLINSNFYEENYKKFPYIYSYNLMKNNIDCRGIISEFKLDNKIIPGNVKRDKEIWSIIFNNMQPNDAIKFLPKLLEKEINIDEIKKITEIKISKTTVHPLELLIILERLSELSNNIFLDIVDDKLEKLLHNYQNNFIHVVDTIPEMLDKDLKDIHLSGAKIASLFARTGKECIDLAGNDFTRNNKRSIVEAEGFSSEEKDYEKVFKKLKSSTYDICVWTKTISVFPKILKIEKELSNNRKIIVINFNEKINLKSSSKNIYVINYFNLKSLEIMNMIKERRI